MTTRVGWDLPFPQTTITMYTTALWLDLQQEDEEEEWDDEEEWSDEEEWDEDEEWEEDNWEEE